MPPRKPRRLKVIAGTLKPSRDRPELELDPIDAPPEPPDFLDVVGAQEFERVAKLLHGAGVLAEVDLGVLTAYAAAWSNLVRHWRHQLPTTAADVTVYRQLCNDLGLSPRARASLPPSDRSKGPNKFAAHGKPPPGPPK